MNSSTNSGKYILTFGVIVIFLNIVLVIFLFLNERGVFIIENNPEDIELEVVSPPVSIPVSLPR